MPFQLKVNVDPALAIPIGNTEFGTRVVDVNDDMLRAVSAEIREELVLAYAAEGSDILGPLRIATWVVVLEALEARVAQKKAAAADAAHQDAETKKRKTEREASMVKLTLALHKWVTAHGTDSQKSRLKEGLLPNDEVLELVHDEVFAEYEDIDRYVPIKMSDFCECGEGQMKRTPAAALGAPAYERLIDLRNDAPKNATVTPYHHIGECKACQGSIARDSIRVAVPWGGVTLHRDFAL